MPANKVALRSHEEVEMNMNERTRVEEWLRALVTDDVDDVKRLLGNDVAETSDLLNAKFETCPAKTLTSDLKFGNNVGAHLSTTWAVTFVYGSFRVAALLRSRQVDIYQTDRNGDNVIHTLINVACIHLDMDERLLTSLTFLRSLLSADEYRRCLKMENGVGLRPLELAAHVGALRFMIYIFETEVGWRHWKKSDMSNWRFEEK